MLIIINSELLITIIISSDKYPNFHKHFLSGKTNVNRNSFQNDIPTKKMVTSLFTMSMKK